MSQRPAPRMWFPLTSKARQAPSAQTTVPSPPRLRPILFKQTATPQPEPLESTALPQNAASVSTVPSSTSTSPSLQLPRFITTVPPRPDISTSPSASTSPVQQLPAPISTATAPLHQVKPEERHASINPPVEDKSTVSVQKTVEDREKDITGTYNSNIGKQEMINKEKEAKAKADQNQRMRVITINGENRGAFIEVIHYPNRFSLQQEKEWKGEDNYSRTAAAFTNTNVQGVNNSIVSFSTFTKRM